MNRFERQLQAVVKECIKQFRAAGIQTHALILERALNDWENSIGSDMTHVVSVIYSAGLSQSNDPAWNRDDAIEDAIVTARKIREGLADPVPETNLP
jgi:hypothetical protein